MESPQVVSPVQPSFGGPFQRSRSNTRFTDDVTSLTSFNPFSEEDENDQSSYTLVASLFSRMKNSIAAPLSSAVAAASGSTASNTTNHTNTAGSEQRRISGAALAPPPNLISRPSSERPFPLNAKPSKPAQPLVSLTPVVSEAPSLLGDLERSPSRGGNFFEDGGIFAGTVIPGFPIQDDARSIRTSASNTIKRSDSVSKVIRRIRGEGLSRDYWMEDGSCKECSDCQSVFTAWRRKHHCRICGQIFCSRCASNIIKGSRFGHDGMIRVCNLCLEKLAKVDSDEEDDRRSVISTITSPFPAHQLGLDSLHHGLPQSPFAAAQLFGRTDEPFNLYSIAETKKPLSGSDKNGLPPINTAWELVREMSAPFRRALVDEEKDPVGLPRIYTVDDSPTANGTKIPLDFPTAMPLSSDLSKSSIQFPLGSPEHHVLDSPGPGSRLRSRFNSHGDFEVSTPFIRSRAQSRLDDLVAGEAGWRTRRESTAYAQELNMASMRHLKIMLRQMLTTEQVPNIKAWEETLLKLALRIARELTFTTLPHRQGQDMDVRRYVKIKKIPGGVPGDSEYVDGVVITKNVAHKQMSRMQQNPRVMLVTFPLEFARVEGQYMHFGQIVRQEKEYLGNLASRIAALRPHVVLVEKSVSRLVLDALAKHNIAVARAVKPSAIHTVARMTQSDVFSSIDKLALEPRLGHCVRYRVQTFHHPLIPGQRKTYMRFEGCSRDMGCTIILRGGDINTLRHIKKVTRFLTFIVRNLKLETHLWKDSVITLPPFNALAVPATEPASAASPLALSPATHMISALSLASTPRVSTPPVRPSSDVLSEKTAADETEIDECLLDEQVAQLRLSKRIQDALIPYTKTFVSVSATLRFPPPQPIKQMKELDDELAQARKAWEEEVAQQEEKVLLGHSQDPTITAPALDLPSPLPTCELILERNSPKDQAGINAMIEALPTMDIMTPPSRDSVSTYGVNFNEPPDYFSDMSSAATSNSGSVILGQPSLNLPPAEDPTIIMKTIEDVALESRLSLAKWRHEEYRRIWEWYLRKNFDDFVLEKYQRINILEYSIQTAELGLHRACFPPELNQITFYGENDCTLGQFIEKSVTDTLVRFLDSKAVCLGKGCNQPLARHCKVYVHNETRLFVAVEEWHGQIIRLGSYIPSPELITTWSACRMCGSATPFIPVSEEMQRYSFGKFLELYFYPTDVKIVPGAGCEHNIYRHHVRFFASKGMTVRFQADPVVLHEVVYPPMRIRVCPEAQLKLKNNDFERLHRRNLLWYSALISDLKLINIDAATGDEESDSLLTHHINGMISRAEAEREEIARMLNDVYKSSVPTDTLALNQVRAFRQDKIVAWQLDFDRLPKPRPTLEKTERKASAFTSVRAMLPKRYDLSNAFEDPRVPSSSTSETEEIFSRIQQRRFVSDSLTSSASEASESEAGMDQPVLDSQAKVPEPSPLAKETASTDTLAKSDPESDSTIGAARDETVSPALPSSPPPAVELQKTGGENGRLRQSKLPRRSLVQPSVAELVKKYQDYLPPQGVRELSKTALAPRPPVSESDQENAGPGSPQLSPRKPRQTLSRNASCSDFEQGYAANVAPRYLAHPRRSQRRTLRESRIPGPVLSSTESVGSSRRQSPDRRISGSSARPDYGLGRDIVHSTRPAGPGANKVGRIKTPVRPMKDKPSAIRAPTNTVSRSPRRPSTNGTKVSNMTKHFERITRETERANRRYTVIRGKRARPVASARAKVEVLDSVKDAVRGDVSESSESSTEADDEGDDDECTKRADEPAVDTTSEASEAPQVVVDPTSDGPKADAPPVVPENLAEPLEKTEQLAEPSVIPKPDLEASSISTSPQQTPALPSVNFPRPGEDVSSPLSAGTPSILQTLGLWIQQTHGLGRIEPDVEDLLGDPEHIFRDSSMVVRTDEPTSIIALALNSPQYRDTLARIHAEKRVSREPKLTDGGEIFMPDDHSVAESTSTWGVVNVESMESADPMQELRTSSSRLPWNITFESGGLTISCTILYPEQFDALRRTYDCEKSMVESLARCVKWNTSGGKSGSAFLKTRDDRFIAKEISKSELQTMETFAPAYFDYMSSAVAANRPTLLAKIFGCYKLTFKKTGKGRGSGRTKSTQMNLLVMENLFYDRCFSKIFDLKGSTRGRLVQSTGRENEVLLDENLVQAALVSPFYLREHSKRILHGALFNDSKFLADINVMDYSLVVGVDSQENELVVGIVDYIRTYTWDKRLETWVKESAFMGGGAKGEPTIVTPKQYRQRFISAMERYFPMVPDRWMKPKDTPVEDPNTALELWPDW